jgi:diacylglycerol kinase (ATP)
VDKATIVYNPRARNAPAIARLNAAIASVAPHGWEVEIAPTEAAGHATALAKEAAAAGASVVFACGGDGTINEVINGLVGGPAALALVRGGMGDVFAKEIGVPKGPEKALRVLFEGTRRRFDLGLANERYFLCMAGIGFDADVVQAVPDPWKKRLGSTSYAFWGVREALRHPVQKVEIKLDGAVFETELYWLLVGNTRSYGGIIDITADAKVDDGLLEAYVFEGRGISWLATTAIRLAMRRHDGARGVSFHRVRELEIMTPGLSVQLDGEYAGETPLRFDVEAGAIEVLIPTGRGERLFSI